jgi:hypothetical protein
LEYLNFCSHYKWIRRYEAEENNRSLQKVGLTTDEVDKWYSLIFQQIKAVFGENSTEVREWKDLVKSLSEKHTREADKDLFKYYKEEKQIIVGRLRALELQYKVRSQQ